MALFLSPTAVNSIWAQREWQSFLARRLGGDTITILPVLLEKCQIPEILADIKYADFSESYHGGFIQLYNALK
jgi:hypothetical protein